MNGWKAWAGAAAALVSLAGGAQAALIDRGNGMIYDSTLNITWLQDWNYARTSGYDSDGLMTWTQAMQWADNLSFGGFTDWRLPTVAPVNGVSFQTGFSNNGSTDRGYAMTGTGWGVGSEMGHLFYVTLGNKGYCTPNDVRSACAPQSGYGPTNRGPFTNLQSFYYWSGTELAPGSYGAWSFDTLSGSQYHDYSKGGWLLAVAVRPGDVVSAVPEPKTYAMLLMGLGVVAVATRRRPLGGFGASRA